MQPSPEWVGPGPSPRELLERALEEPNLLDLSEHQETIRVLRAKGYSFREIADWLNGHGVETNHSAVYRVYKQGMSEAERFAMEQEEERREQLGIEEDD